LRRIAAADGDGPGGLARGMLGSGAALGVLEEAIAPANGRVGERLLEAVLAGAGMDKPAHHVKCVQRPPGAFAAPAKDDHQVLGPVRVMRPV